MMETIKNFLRDYNGYTIYEVPKEEGVELASVISEFCGEERHRVRYDPDASNDLNKAIEMAKEWINKNPVNLPKYSDDDLREFRVIIDNKLEAAEKELLYLSASIGKSDEREKEQLEQMAKRQETYINNLKEALQRIEIKTYGVCRVTGKLIDKARLRAVPHATLSIEAKKMATETGTESSPAEKQKSKRKKAEKSIVKDDVQRCRVCGCTEDNCSQCIAKTGFACHWVEDDLCSACVPVQDVPFETKISTPINQDDMNFFQQLVNAGAGKVDITIRIMQKNDTLTINIMPGSNKSTDKPFNISGTAAELDEGFFTSVYPGVEELKGLRSNLAEVLKEDNDKKTQAEKSKASKKESKKPADKKDKAKKPEKKKVKPVKEEKVVPAEASLFDQPAEVAEAGS